MFFMCNSIYSLLFFRVKLKYLLYLRVFFVGGVEFYMLIYKWKFYRSFNKVEGKYFLEDWLWKKVINMVVVKV